MKMSPQEKQFSCALMGVKISLEEAARLIRYETKRNKVLSKEFGLNHEEISTLLCNKEKVVTLIRSLKEKDDADVQERMRKIEAVALKKMHDPRRGRQLRALLSGR